jgi:hypothetical protein
MRFMQARWQRLGTSYLLDLSGADPCPTSRAPLLAVRPAQGGRWAASCRLPDGGPWVDLVPTSSARADAERYALEYAVARLGPEWRSAAAALLAQG